MAESDVDSLQGKTAREVRAERKRHRKKKKVSALKKIQF